METQAGKFHRSPALDRRHCRDSGLHCWNSGLHGMDFEKDIGVKRFWRYLKLPTWLMVLPLLFMMAHATTALAAQTPSSSATASGTTSNLTLTAGVNIADADVGRNGNIYLAFQFHQLAYANNGTGWVQYEGGALPVYAAAPLANRTIEVVVNTDLSSLVGGQLYIGYGLTESDMLANGKYAMVYTVMADTTAQPAPVLLGTSGDLFAILAKAGFTLSADGTNVFSTSTQVVGGGRVFAADFALRTPANLATAILDMQTAHTDGLKLASGNIGGLTLAPGIYDWGSSVTVPADVTISGGPDDVWILHTSGDLIMSAGTRITLAGGAQAKNIFWHVGGPVTIGTNAHFEGIILALTAITLQTGATMNGRVLGQAMGALDNTTVTMAAP